VLYVHEREEQFRQQLAVATRNQAVFEVTTPDRFPYLRIPDGAHLIFERGGAGTVNPRVLVANQLRAAQARGARVVRDHVVRIEQLDGGARVHTASGAVMEADRVLVAVGGYVNAFELFPEPLPVVATGITALFFEVPDDSIAAESLADMPGTFWYEAHHDHFLYSVPPTRYPDGRTWFKIGGYRESGPLHSAAEIDDWYRTDGGRLEADMLRDWVAEHIPVLTGRDAHSVGCVVTDVASGFPMIREVSPNVVVATGCAGAAAKSCDEIGRLAAVLTVEGRWDSSLDQSLFQG
jgi:sarcosine oxidase